MALDPEEIHYGIGGERFGPVDVETVRALITEGRLALDDYIWDDDLEDWVEVGRYPTLTDPEHAQADDDGLLRPTPPDPIVAKRELPYAGFWIRLAAWLVDILILAGPITIWENTVENLTGMTYTQIASDGPSSDPQMAWEQLKFLMMLNAGALVVRGLYWVLLESSRWQGTVGKRLLGLVVTDNRGYRLSRTHAAGRFAGRALCELTIGLGYLMILFNRRRQGLHDRVAGTVVVRR